MFEYKGKSHTNTDNFLAARSMSVEGFVDYSCLFFVLFAFLFILALAPLFNRFNLTLYDSFSNVASKYPSISNLASKDLSDNIVMVLVDDDSLMALPGLLQNQRETYAEVLDYISQASPKAVGLDVFFAGPSVYGPGCDNALAEALSRTDTTVLRAFQRDEGRITPPYSLLAYNSEFLPNYFSSYYDEFTRTSSLFFVTQTNEVVYSMQVELARLYWGIEKNQIALKPGRISFRVNDEDKVIHLFNNNYMLINFEVGFESYRAFSFKDVYERNVPADEFKDKVVIIGSANSMTELVYNPPLDKRQFSAAMTAASLQTILSQRAFRPISKVYTYLLSAALLMIALVLFVKYLNPFPSFFLMISVLFALIVFSFYLLVQRAVLFDVLEPIFVLTSSFVFAAGTKYYTEISEKLRIKSAFQHYVTASVVNEILKNPEKLNLHGEERNLSIFFSDIEGFTSLSEGMSPLDVVAMLNDYLTAMTEIIFKYNGLLDKYEGDAIMAVFGAPVDQRDHAQRACRCALENQKALKKLRIKFKEQGRPELRIRIGINTGNVVVGNMGSNMRFDYTAIGDNVNLAARLETANKLFGTDILVSRSTAKAAGEKIISRCVGKMRPAGKSMPVEVYEVMGILDEPDKELLKELLKKKESFNRARDTFQNSNYQDAAKMFKEHLNHWKDDKPAERLLKKSEGFLVVAPPPDWEDIVEQAQSG